MVFPSDFEAKIGFDAIRGLVKEFCIGPGKIHAEEMGFSDDLSEIRQLLGQTEELRRSFCRKKIFLPRIIMI